MTGSRRVVAPPNTVTPPATRGRSTPNFDNDNNKKMNTIRHSTLLTGIALLSLSSVASADGLEPAGGSDRVEIWITRHAEKQTLLQDLGSGLFQEVCNEIECAEELNPEGELRAELLADWFERRGITERVTHVFSSHKTRTRQTVEQIAADAGLVNDYDLIPDGVQQLPSNLMELDAKASASEDITAETLLALAPGSVAVVGAHSGTIYDILDKMGADTSDPDVFPRRADNGKVPTFGDLWRVTIRTKRNGETVVRVNKRIQLQPTKLVRTEIERPDEFAPPLEIEWPVELSELDGEFYPPLPELPQ